MQAFAGDTEDGAVLMNKEEINRARADFYAFLSRIFLEEPPRELARDMANGNFVLPEASPINEEFAEGVSLLREFMNVEKDSAKVYDTLCSEYTRLFIGPVPVMFPYESMYIDGSMMSKSLLKVKEEYRRAGLGKLKAYHEPEDHIAVELAFMAYLCRENGSPAMQRGFIHNHLLKWVPKFSDELFEKSVCDFFRGAGRLTTGFLMIEKETLGSPE